MGGGVYLQWVDAHASTGLRFATQAAFQAGQRLFQALFTLQAVLIALITPAITSGAITLEREQRTLEMVALSRLKPLRGDPGKARRGGCLRGAPPHVVAAAGKPGLLPRRGLSGRALLYLPHAPICRALLRRRGDLCSAVVPGPAAATVLAFGSIGAFCIAPFVTIPIVLGGPSAPLIPFRSLSPVGAVLQATSSETFLRDSVPSWLPAVVLLGLAAFLAANLAMARLEFYHDARTAPIRLLATALWGLAFLHLVAHTVGLPGFQSANAKEVRGTLATLAGIDIALLLLLIPPLATGPLLGVKAREHLRGLLPHRALRDGVATGAPMLLLWLLLPFLFILGSVALVRPSYNGTALGVLLPAGLAAVAMTAAFIALGHALSVWLPSRGPALGLTYALIAAAALLPYLTLVEWHNPLDVQPLARGRFV